MVQLQLISKILETKDFSIVTDNLLDESYFVGYEDEYNFIKDHLENYGQVPDKATFLAKFPNIELVEVTESDSYLVDTIREESLYHRSVPVLEKMAELLKTDSNAAVDYMQNAIHTLEPTYHIGGTDIIKNATDRYSEYEDVKEHQDDWYFTTGFPELDDLIHGIRRKEELVVIYARTNMGKSWILEKICQHIWKIGFNIGYVSPEMGASSIGYRFDTLDSNFSNSSLLWGNDAKGYKEYIESLSQDSKSKFIVSTPKDFGKKITVSKLKQYIREYDIKLLAVDGIKYLTDERYKKGDSLTTSLTNISEDLIELSNEMCLPICVVVQSNRNGVMGKDDKGTPELDSIRDSDGIAMNATKVLAIRQSKEGLEIGVKKQRFGAVGGRVLYDWDIDKGKFINIPVENGTEQSSKEVEKIRKKYTKADITEVF